MDVDRPNDMLVEIEVAEKLSREKIVSTYEEDMVGQKVLSRFVGDQMLRGMMELQLNGCTSFQFARSLLLDGMAELGLAPEKWRAPTEKPGGVLCHKGNDRRRSFVARLCGWR